MNTYKKYLKIFFTFTLGSLFLIGCGNGNENFNTNDTEETHNSQTENLPKIKNPTFKVENKNESIGTVYIHITSLISNENSTNFYDNDVIKVLDEGTTADGFITLNSGRHRIKLCATNDNGQFCSNEQVILVSKEVASAEYKQISIEHASTGLANNGKELIYGTTNGKIYALDINTQDSTFIYDVNEMISGLVYVDINKYYYTSIQSRGLYTLDIGNSSKNKIATIPFPDGLDKFQNKLYMVTNDTSGILTILNLTNNVQSSLNTNIDDMVGISHTEKFLYILSEDGHIYQTNPTTGKSHKIFDNTNLFAKGNNNFGLEAISILNKRVYVSYVNDTSIYLIDIDLSLYE